MFLVDGSSIKWFPPFSRFVLPTSLLDYFLSIFHLLGSLFFFCLVFFLSVNFFFHYFLFLAVSPKRLLRLVSFLVFLIVRHTGFQLSEIHTLRYFSFFSAFSVLSHVEMLVVSLIISDLSLDVS